MNIELRGFSITDAVSLRQDIVKKFEHCVPISICRQTVVSVVSCDVEDRFAAKVPFIRIYSDKMAEFDLAMTVLRKVKFIADSQPSIVLECCKLHKCFEL